MSEEKSIEDSIRVALDAAELANDVATDIASMKASHHAASRKLDAFAKTSSRVTVGALIGATVSISLGGLVYFKTLKEMRTLHAANLEALSMFTMTVTDLQTTTDDMKVMLGKSDIKTEAQMDSLTAMQEQLQRATDDMELRLAKLGEREMVSNDDLNVAVASMQPYIDQAVEASNAQTAAMVADLQLTLTRMMEKIRAPKPTSRSAAPSKEVKKPAPKAPPKKTSTVKKSAKPSPNPFNYP